MTTLYRCDNCNGIADPEAFRIDVNICNTPIKPPERDENDDLVFELRVFNGEAQYHFCSSACLGSWGMSHALDGKEPE